MLSAALIAGAVFLVVSVEAFRRDGPSAPADCRSGTGGAALVAESLLPIIHDPESPEGREALNLRPDDEAVPPFSLTAFRLSEGDDVSCVNLLWATAAADCRGARDVHHGEPLLVQGDGRRLRTGTREPVAPAATP